MNGTAERSDGQPSRGARIASRTAGLALAIAVAAALALLLAGLGNRWGWWSYRAAFAVLRVALYGLLAAAALGVIGAGIALVASARGAMLSGLAAMAVAIAVGSLPLGYIRTARQVPPIHDITTDTGNPPRLQAILPLRRDAPNSADYGGPELAALQRRAYPDLAPAVLPAPPDRVFEAALRTARKLGWMVVAAVPAEGRLEATDTTRWFGFKDDVVVRVAPAAEGSRVDVRSVSRVGRSDVGTNARRIRAFLRELRSALAA